MRTIYDLSTEELVTFLESTRACEGARNEISDNKWLAEDCLEWMSTGDLRWFLREMTTTEDRIEFISDINWIADQAFINREKLLVDKDNEQREFINDHPGLDKEPHVAQELYCIETRYNELCYIVNYNEESENRACVIKWVKHFADRLVFPD